MTDLKVKVAIIGAGSAGLSAARQVSKATQDFVLINGGHYGTTCARVGCMPSKLMIQSAQDFHRRKKFDELGIQGADKLNIDIEKVMQRVRYHRDRFVSFVIESTDNYGDKNIKGYAEFVQPGVLQVDGRKIIAEKIIIATGSTPIMPPDWQSDRTLTSDNIFEQSDFSQRIAVIGTGVIGLELGLALAHMGKDVHFYGSDNGIAPLVDKEVKGIALEILSKDAQFTLGHRAKLTVSDSQVQVTAGEQTTDFDQAVIAIGRRPNLSGLKLENSGLPLDSNGVPKFDPNTMQIEGTPHYIAGDINAERPLLHEASDEGVIAGHNAVNSSAQCFQRRAPMAITFTHPEIASVGKWPTTAEGFVFGSVSFEDQGRSRVMAENHGMLKVCADSKTGRFVAAEMIGPRAEHIAHLLAWSLQSDLTVFDMLARPFYHPVVEEGLRTAIRNCARSVEGDTPQSELMRCESVPVEKD